MIPFRYIAILLLICFSLPNQINGQNIQAEQLQAPKREMRAAWVATVLNIDYPKKPSNNPISLKEQYKNMLDKLQGLGMNTIILQVRPAADAIYPSDYAPWSGWLTGRQGNPPLDEFDPLAFIVEETHRRSMELHAWINPFRASMNLDTAKLYLTHPVFRHPDWLVAYGNKMYFNPGIPAVRDHMIDIVGELVDNYNLDGIHIDDYFYPYPIADTPFPDSATYKFYGQPHKDIGSWRRSNTDKLVQSIYERIKTTKPNMQFGVSPFGVWRNKSDDPARGSNTRAGVTSYDDLHADVLNWINKGWIDYVMPQIYWNIGYEPADYQTLVQWWSRNIRNAQLFIGHAAYKVGNNAVEAWNDPGEMGRQINLNRRNFQSSGSAYFSTKSLLNNPLRLKDTLRHYYRAKALWPERPELELPKSKMVDLRKPRFRKNALRLRWRINPEDKTSRSGPHYFVIYRFEGTKTGDIENPKNILAITPFREVDTKMEYYDRNIEIDETYTYLVTAVNRAHIESNPSENHSILRKNERRIKRLRGNKKVKVRTGGRKTKAKIRVKKGRRVG